MERERLRYNFATLRVSLAVAQEFVGRLLLVCIIRVLSQNVIDDLTCCTCHWEGISWIHFLVIFYKFTVFFKTRELSAFFYFCICAFVLIFILLLQHSRNLLHVYDVTVLSGDGHVLGKRQLLIMTSRRRRRREQSYGRRLGRLRCVVICITYY